VASGSPERQICLYLSNQADHRWSAAGLIPLTFVLLSQRQFRYRRVSVWSGGRREDARRIATTSLAFSNALSTIYVFIYGPTHNLEREYGHGPYFVKRLIFRK
jgi:hydrogenase-4 component B